jgi:Zn2+/Cd2+-exporting ATPase
MLSRVDTELLRSFQNKAGSKAVLLMAVEDELVLALSLADELRSEAKEFISSVQGMHIAVSRDQTDVAEEICRTVNISIQNCHARLLPYQKLSWINQQQHEDKKNGLMIGDGINDSIALAASTIGVAMGAEGTAMAVAAADVVLMNDNLMLLPPALKLCKQAKQTIIENFTFAVVIKIAAIILAILGKYI